MGEQDGRSSGHPRIGVGGMRGDLLVPHADEVDLAVGHRREHGDVGVAAQAEDMRDAAALEVADQLMGNEIAHFTLAVFGLVQHSPGLQRFGIVKFAEQFLFRRAILGDRAADPGRVHVMAQA